MLVIRSEQLEVFRPIADDKFTSRLIAYVLAQHPGTLVKLPGGNRRVVDLPPGALDRLVNTGIARARSRGLTWESSIAAFVTLMFVASPNFDTDPLIDSLLSRKDKPADLRIDDILQETPPAVWRSVADTYLPGAWIS